MPSPKFIAHAGAALPLGTSATSTGTNFAIYAREAEHVVLVIRKTSASGERIEFVLDPRVNRTGHVWHAELQPACAGACFLWRVGKEKDERWVSNECLDPWARVVESPIGAAEFNKGKEYVPWGVVSGVAAFDWQGVVKPKVKWPEMVVYEIHVRGFTVAGDGVKAVSGTFLGVVERIPYLRALGVNAVELLPVMEFNEKEWGEGLGKGVCQYWGYSTVAFFSLMNRYGKEGGAVGDVVNEFKLMVRELHRVGIEVIMDVVYNHTAEMGFDYVGRGFYGMKTLAPFSYYIMKDGGRKFLNVSGCGNTVNCNNVAVQDLICESLRYWAVEMGVDGFRFDLASVLCRGTDGEPLESPPIIERMTKDPVMRDVKLIAEPWDCGGLYQVGSFPHFGVWAEWNGKFRDCVRRFIKGDAGMIGDFATRLCGSADLYKGGGRKPFHSLNFVTAHDGFSMWDLVSYNEKHNDSNGEGNQDGEWHNDSWNCGVEGETEDMGVVALRRRQVKNMMVALLVAAGTPMLCMGDEYGHTQQGNNNGWCQDSSLTWFDWNAAKKDRHSILRFTQKMVQFRRSMRVLHRQEFLSDGDVTWHGSRAGCPEWGSGYNFLAAAFKGECEVYVAFNAGGQKREVELPWVEGGWERVVDSNLESPKDFADVGEGTRLEGGGRYGMNEYSCLVLRQRGKMGGNLGNIKDAFAAMEVSCVST
eukprot:GFKZ01009962.1.p1 GENE.GFKZ01009962.1~~GFKZ01009962.1.p1  ORF type:complete len:700 (+),score=89.95 GFKZ01009962.1:120-2219(+)